MKNIESSLLTSVSDPYTFYTDPDPGFFSIRIRIRLRIQVKNTFFQRPSKKCWEKYRNFLTKKVGTATYFLKDIIFYGII